jgi:DNA-binding NarL/FixJ family response regulator
VADKIRIALADDHSLVRQGIRQFLEGTDDLEVVGEASDGAGALKLVGDLLPDVALLDVQMPGLSGVEATRQIKTRFPQVRVLALTAYDDEAYVFALLEAGADGYLLKSISVDELQRAVRAAHRGESILSPEITEKVLRRVKTGRPAGAATQIEELTSRELEILRLAAQGLTNKAIGKEVGISSRTAQGHLANIYAKLHVASRTEAVTEALRRGWIILS